MSQLHRGTRLGLRRLRRRRVAGRGLSTSQWLEESGDTGTIRRAIVEVTGDVDGGTAEHLFSALDRALRFNPVVCCDLNAVWFFGVAGVDVLGVVHLQAIEAQRFFSVRGVRGRTTRVFAATGLNTLLTVMP